MVARCAADRQVDCGDAYASSGGPGSAKSPELGVADGEIYFVAVHHLVEA